MGRPDPNDRPGSMLRGLAWYFGGLLVTYALAVATLWPRPGEEPNPMLFLVIMFAPTVGALLARWLGGGRIQWGRPSWWLLAGLLPVAFTLVGYLVGVALGGVQAQGDLAATVVLHSPLLIGSACLSAVGEEIGWRGYLWPALRGRFGFLAAAGLLLVVWWLYHVPLIIAGLYGSLGGLAAFTVAIAGFVLFVGVLTDRSRSLWPSVVAHGAWNGLIAKGFATLDNVPVFTGSEAWVGEFGWPVALSCLVLGVSATLWHLRTPSSMNAEVAVR